MGDGGRISSIFIPSDGSDRLGQIPGNLAGRAAGGKYGRDADQMPGRAAWNSFSWRIGFLPKRASAIRWNLVYATPLPGAFTKPKASAMLGNLMEKKEH